MRIGILFPHQLFEQHPLLGKCDTIYLVEEWLYFRQYNFHQQKIVFHRASMKAYQSYLASLNVHVEYIDAFNDLSDIRNLIPQLKSIGIEAFEYIDTTDQWLEQRITRSCSKHGVKAHKNASELFLMSTEENTQYFSGRKRMFQTDFYN